MSADLIQPSDSEMLSYLEKYLAVDEQNVGVSSEGDWYLATLTMRMEIDGKGETLRHAIAAAMRKQGDGKGVQS